MKAEQILLNNGVTVEVIPLPKTIVSDCGLALRVDSKELGCAYAALAERGAQCVKTYDANFKIIDDHGSADA
jgi:hypothetical protein